jgi:hypothetical protein
LLKIQNSRNLTNPPLIEYQGRGGTDWINLSHYEPLLQKYHQRYRERYPEDYTKLFPEEEPEWERASLPKKRAEMQDEIYNLLAPLEQALPDRQQAVERLTEENQKLQAELVALQVALQKEREAPPGTPSPERTIADFDLT